NGRPKQKTSIGKGTSAKEPEERNEKDVRSKDEEQHNIDPKPSCSEVQHPGQQKSIVNKQVQLQTVVNQKPKQKTSIGEAMPLKQMKSINKTSESEEIFEEVDNNIELKPIPRLSEKPGPSVPGTTIKDNDSTSVIKKVTQDKETTERDIGHKTVHPQPPSKDSNRETWVQLVASQNSFINQYLRERFEAEMIEGTETSECDRSDVDDITSTSQGRTHSMKVTQDKETTERDIGHKTVHPQPPSKDSNRETWVQLVASQNSFINQYLRERFEAEMIEGTETSECDRSDVDDITSTSQGRTHSMQKMSSRQEYTSSQLEHLSAEKCNEEMWAQLSATQQEYITQLLWKDCKKKNCKTYKKPESNICPNRVPIPKKPKEKAYLKQNMTKQNKNHDGKDAHVHSRLPLLRRKEEVEEQDDWHHTQLMDLLREDIKEIVKEQLAIERARMRERLQKDPAEITRQFQNEVRQTAMENMALLQEQVKETQQELWKLHLQQKELLQKDLAEITRQFQNELRQTAMENMALMQEQVKETQQELWKLHLQQKELLQKDLAEITRQFQNELRQTAMENMALLQEQVKETQQELWKLHLQQKELFREDLKEMIREEIKNSKIAICPKEEPLPEATKGTAAFQRTPREPERKKKYEVDHHSAPSHSEKPPVQTEEEIIDVQSDSHCISLAELMKNCLNEPIDVVLEKYKYYTHKKEQEAHILKGRRQKITQEQEMEKKYNDGCASLSSWASVKTDEVTVGQQSALQYKDFRKHIGENAKEMVHEQLENSELIVHPKEKPLPDDSRRKISTKPLTPGDFTLPPILHVSPPLSGPSRFIGPRDIQTLLEEESGPSNFLGPIINQTPLEKEDPEASKHLWRKRTQKHPDTLGGRGPRSTQTPLDQEDPGAPRHLWWKSGPRQFLEPRSTQTSLEEESLPRTQELPDTIGPRDLLLLPIRGKNGTTSMHK
ncbi:hypothetical protein STEG23_016857, partial [Scotinomys teguina]